jgi:hypothetical protein
MQLAKSLHTITVLENIGRHLMLTEGHSANEAVHRAIHILRLNDKDDVYGLADKAIAKLEAEAKKPARSCFTGRSAELLNAIGIRT